MSSWSAGRWSRSVPSYQDVAFHNGKVYAVANGGDLYEHEISEDSDTGVSGVQQVIAAPAPPLLGGYLQVRSLPYRKDASEYLMLFFWKKSKLLPSTITKV